MRRTRAAGLPSSIFVTLKYSEAYAPSAVLTSLQQFKANDPRDPDFTGGGHQPHYFDQYIAFYRRYMVYSCGIFITAHNLSNDPQLVGVWPSVTNAVLVNNGPELLETPKSRTIHLGSKSAKDTGSLRHFATTRSLKGEGTLDITYSGNASTGPETHWYWNVFLAALAGANVNVQYTVTLTQRVRFFNRQEVDQS